MKFPGKRKSSHYFPTGDQGRIPFDRGFARRENIYIVGVEQLLVDIEVNVTDDFLLQYGIKKGQSQILDDELVERIYQQLKAEKRIVGEYPGGSIGNTLHNYSVLSDDRSVAVASICKTMSVSDYAFKYVANTCSNVDFSYLQPCDGAMGIAICFVTPDSERSFAIGRGIMNELSEEFISKPLIENAALLLVTAYTLRDPSYPIYHATMKAIKIAHAANVPVVLSLGTSFIISQNRSFFEELCKNYVNILAMNELEAQALVGESDPLLAVEKSLDLVDMVLLTVGPQGLYMGGHVDTDIARQTKDYIHSKSIPEYNKFEYSRAMLKKNCKKPIKIFTHINPFMGGPGGQIKNTNGAGDAALAAVLHDIAANRFHSQVIPNSPKHIKSFLTYSSLHQISKYANRVSFEVLIQNSPRLTRGLPMKEDNLEESYWER